MTAPSPTFTATETAFHVETYEKVDYSLLYVDGAFRVGNPEIADSYRPFGRCLMVVDETVYGLYGEQMHAYFDHHGLALTVFPVTIRERSADGTRALDLGPFRRRVLVTAAGAGAEPVGVVVTGTLEGEVRLAAGQDDRGRVDFGTFNRPTGTSEGPLTSRPPASTTTATASSTDATSQVGA